MIEKFCIVIIIMIIIISFVLFFYYNVFGDGRMTEKENIDFWYDMKIQNCLTDTRFLLSDLSDTWGSDTNNQDSISKSMLIFYDKCLERVDSEYKLKIENLREKNEINKE